MPKVTSGKSAITRLSAAIERSMTAAGSSPRARIAAGEAGRVDADVAAAGAGQLADHRALHRDHVAEKFLGAGVHRARCVGVEALLNAVGPDQRDFHRTVGKLLCEAVVVEQRVAEQLEPAGDALAVEQDRILPL